MKRFLISSFICVIGVTIGIALAIAIHSSLMLVENKGCLMLPEVEPEQKVLVLLATSPFASSNYKQGDIVAYEPETYGLEGEGIIAFRRVIGTVDDEELPGSGDKVYADNNSGKYLRISCDVNLVDEKSLLIAKEDILGRAIIY